MIRARTVALSGWFVAALAATSAAQAPPLGRIELAAGVTRVGHSAFGARDATLSTATGSTSRLFSTSTTLLAGSGWEGRVGFRLRGPLEAEAFASYTKPLLETSISNDVEGAAGVTATETVQQYIVGGAGIWHLRYRPTARVFPYVVGGAAYLRQLHGDGALAVTGRVYEGGLGAKYLFVSRRTGGLNAFGVRVDARVQAVLRGAAFDGVVHYRPALTAMAFARF
jgi:hypothetical protein